MIGKTLGGSYSIYEPSGGDGPFELYVARDLRSDTVVDVRILGAGADPVLAQQFLERARTLQQTADSRIVRVLDVGAESEYRYAVLEHPEGVSLDKILEDHGRMLVPDAVGLVYQTLHALEFAHGAGILHRRITPQRLVVDSAGLLRLTGLEAPPAGPPSAYSAPEETGKGPVDGRSDLFSVGVILYELLTARLPFGEAEGTTADQSGASAPRLRLLRPDVPRELELLMERVLDPDPARRPASAADMASALEAAMQGKPYELATAVATGAVAPVETHQAVAKSHTSVWTRILIGVAGLAVVLAAGTTILTTSGIVPLATTSRLATAAPLPQPTQAPVAAVVSTAPPSLAPTVSQASKTPQSSTVEATPTVTASATAKPGVTLVRQYPEKDSMGITWQVQQWSDGSFTRQEIVPPPVLASIGAKVNAVRFFESGPEGLSLQSRDYGTRFAKASTRYMNYELDLSYPITNRPVDFTLRAFYYDSSGKQLVEQVQTAHIEAGWTQSYHWNGYGWPTPGNWAVGTYRLDLYDGPTKIASASFEIY